MSSSHLSPLQRSWSRSSMDHLDRITSEVQDQKQKMQILYNLEIEAIESLYAGRTADALKSATIALNTCKKMHSTKHTAIVYPLLLLGEIHLRMNRVDNTQKCLNAAHKIITGSPGLAPTDPLYQQFLYDQGKVIIYEGDYSEALKTFMVLKGLVDGDMANPKEPLAANVKKQHQLRLAAILCYIGTCHIGLGNIQQAMTAHMSSYRIRRSVLGPEALDTALSACHVANTYMKNGDTDVAQRIFVECRPILERGGACSQPDLATLHLNTSICQLIANRNSDGRIEMGNANAALNIREKLYGSGSINTAAAQLQLGRCALAVHDYNSALEYVENARQTFVGTLGPAHVLSASAGAVYATVLHHLGRGPEARDTVEESYTALARHLGETNEQTVAAASMLADIHLMAGETAEAEAIWSRIVTVRHAASRSGGKGEHKQPNETVQAAAAAVSAANVRRQAGELKKAAGMYKAALAVIKTALGPNHPMCATVYVNLGGLLVAAGRLEQGRRFLAHALTIRQRRCGDDHLATVHARLALGDACTSMEDFGAALEHMQAGLKTLDAMFGPDHPETVAVKKNIANVLRRRILSRRAERV